MKVTKTLVKTLNVNWPDKLGEWLTSQWTYLSDMEDMSKLSGDELTSQW